MDKDGMQLLYQLTFCWQKFALLFKSYEKILILACNGGLSIGMPLGEGVQIMSHRNHSLVFAKKISDWGCGLHFQGLGH